MCKMTRKVYTYRYTLMAAETMLSQAKVNKEIDNSIAVIIFCAFSLEGYLNYVGEELISDWNISLERNRPKDKLKIIIRRFDLDVVWGNSPFQSFSTIFKIRDQLAHPKTKIHNYKDSKGKIWIKIGTGKWPVDKWEKLCKVSYAEQFLSDTKSIISTLDSKLKMKHLPKFILSENI